MNNPERFVALKSFYIQETLGNTSCNVHLLHGGMSSDPISSWKSATYPRLPLCTMSASFSAPVYFPKNVGASLQGKNEKELEKNRHQR
jgi:hypothetical protein